LAGRIGPRGFRALYDYSPAGILFTAPDGRVLAANPAACEILGRKEAEICALGRRGLADPDDERWESLLAERQRLGHAHGVARMIRGDGSLIQVEMSARIFTETTGEERSCTIIRDVTERVEMERELAQMTTRLQELALTDELTGVHNRRAFALIGSKVLELAGRQGLTVAALFVDVDDMKGLNDRHGHAAGDRAIRAVAEALSESLRRADTVARIGGDEFAALGVSLDEDNSKLIEQRIRARLSAPAVTVAVGRVVEVSLGWATCDPEKDKTVQGLLTDADRAMYKQKVIKD
jgi:diguanylate cyclase (GGDEF)-like protein/PAS domain S-box-containing protein